MLWIYALDKIYQFQHLGHIKFDENKDNIKQTMEAKYPEIKGLTCTIPETNRCSKEFLAYVEHLMWACPYYKQDDARIALRTPSHDQYNACVKRYGGITVSELHALHTEKFST